MTARTLSSLLLLAGFVTLGLIVSRHPEDADVPSTEVERTDPPVDSGEDVDRYGGYSTLVRGGPMYAGTVMSVTVTRFEEGPPTIDARSIRFRVDKKVAGANVKELTLNYWWLDESVPDLSLHGFGNTGPWRERPRAGQRLLLLLMDEAGVEAAKQNGRFDQVSHVWRGVRADHPLVQGFQDAVKFIAGKDTKTQDRLFRQLCQSPFPSLRLFAFEAAFFAKKPPVFGGTYSSVRQAQLMLQYLRVAVPRISDDEERYRFTTGLSAWFRSPRAKAPAYQAPEVAGPLRAAFENWYLTALGAVDQPRRCQPALEELAELIEKLGPTPTLALFPKGGRAALDKRLRACVRAQDTNVQQLSQKLLDRVGLY